MSDVVEKMLSYRECPACDGKPNYGGMCLLCMGRGKLMGLSGTYGLEPNNMALRADFEHISTRCTCGADEPLTFPMEAGEHEETCPECGKTWIAACEPRMEIQIHEKDRQRQFGRPWAEGTY